MRYALIKNDLVDNVVEVETIMPISARLIVNQAALKTKREPLRALIDAFERASAALPAPTPTPTP